MAFQTRQTAVCEMLPRRVKDLRPASVQRDCSLPLPSEMPYGKDAFVAFLTLFAYNGLGH